METLVHTVTGELKLVGPILTEACKACKAAPNATPVPCMSGRTGSKGEPCQCWGCVESYKSVKY